MNLNLSISSGNNDPPKKKNIVAGQLTWDALHAFILSRGLGETIRKQIIKDIKKTPPTAYPHVVANFNKYILRRMEANESKKEEFSFGKEEETSVEKMPNTTRSEDGISSEG
jgi:hypothetical protein